MAEKTDEQIAKDNSTTIDALSVYLDDVAPAEQFGSNPLYRIGNIQPIQSQEDLFERGLIGEDGLLTPKGDLYQTLSDNGLINPDGTLPEKSAAFMMDEDDALKPENLDAYVIRRENKIGEKPMSWGDTFGGLGELLWDAGAGLGTTATTTAATGGLLLPILGGLAAGGLIASLFKKKKDKKIH